MLRNILLKIVKKMDVTVRTLQHYDKEGLLSPSAVRDGGRRLYTDKDIVNLEMKHNFYWLIKHFDSETLDHIRSRFDRESGMAFLRQRQHNREWEYGDSTAIGFSARPYQRRKLSAFYVNKEWF